MKKADNWDEKKSDEMGFIDIDQLSKDNESLASLKSFCKIGSSQFASHCKKISMISPIHKGESCAFP